MASRNFYEHIYDFHGHDVYSATQADNAPFRIKDTSAAGAPTCALVTPSECGELATDLANTNESEIMTLYQSDILQFKASKIREVEWRVKMNQAALTSPSMLAFGLASAQNDTIDSLTNLCLFRVIGGDSTTLVVCESDDGTTDKDDVATGKTLINAYKDFLISFAKGLRDVRFFIDGQPVAEGTTFDLSAMTGSFQLFAQLQKASGTQVDGYTVDRIRIAGRR